MKKLILALGLFTVTAHAGYTTGDKIEFQSEAAWVSAVYSKSLCLAGDTYTAVISKCVAWNRQGGEDLCTKSVKVVATQPMNSTREICVSGNGDNSNGCTKYATVAFNQSPVRSVNFYNNRNDLVKTATVTIPACGE